MQFIQSATSTRLTVSLVLVFLYCLLPIKVHATAYNIADATYTRMVLSVTAQDVSPTAMIFNNDGTKLYVLGGASDNVNEYSLTTAYDISTASFTRVALYVGAQEANPNSLIFNNDGTKLYVIGQAGDDINEYSLATAYDISTASFTQIALSVAAQETFPRSMLYNNDGTKLYVLGASGDDINEYSLATAYDISTASFTRIALSVAAQETNPFDLTFNSNGTKLYVLGAMSDNINEYTLTSAYDISTASFAQVALSVATQDTTPDALLFNNNGTKLYVIGISGGGIYEYSLIPDTTKPTISLTAPAAMATVAGESVTITASATDDTAVAGVKFYADGILVGSEVTAAPYSIVWNTASTSYGVKIITAVARDIAGNVATSTPRGVVVDNRVTIGTLTESTARGTTRVSWNTQNNGYSRLYFGIVHALQASTPEEQATTTHTVTLPFLPPCSVYTYVAVTRDLAGVSATSTERSFTTACTGDATISAHTEKTVVNSTGDTLTHSGATIIVPPGFTTVSNAVDFQISTLDADAVIASAATAESKARFSEVYHLNTVYDDTVQLNYFDVPLTVTLAYTGNPDISSLFIARYDGTEWHNLGGVVDTVAKTITATTVEFSDFSVFGTEQVASTGSTGTGSSASGSTGGGTTLTMRVKNLIAMGNIASARTLLSEMIAVLQKQILALAPHKMPSTMRVLGAENTAAVGGIFTRNLDVNDEGADVIALQKFLIHNGYPLDSGATGYFGAQTREALAKYQLANHIMPAVGYFGPLTRAVVQKNGE